MAQSMKPSNSAGAGCLTLFALPFCGAGLFSLYQFAKQLNEGSRDWEKTAGLGIAGLAFAGVGFGLVVMGRYGQAKLRERDQLKQLHPGTPWMWRKDWAEGRVTGSNRSTMIFAWAFAGFWNLVSAPMLIFLPEEVLEKGNHLAAIGALFPIVGLGLLYWAVKATLRWRKFGACTFEMTTLPGVIGGRVRGTIHTALSAAPDSGVVLHLNCVSRTEGRGKNDSASERLLWQDERRAPRESLHPVYRGITVPVDFVVPFECAPTDEDEANSGTQILWRLHADAEVAGVDYSTQFEIPVFKTAASSAEPLPAVDSRYSFHREETPAFDPREATVRVSPSALGGTEYYFGPARNLGAALGMTFFTVLWAGAIWLMLHLGAPIFFPIVFGLFLLLLLLFMADLWLASTRVAIESGNVRIRSTLLGIGGAREIPCSEITGVKLGSSMQQHATMTQAGRVYYDIELHRKVGKKVSAGKHIRNKREVEWLVGEMKRRIEAFQH